MYSGDDVFYGIKMSAEQAYELLISYAEKHKITLNDVVDFDCDCNSECDSDSNCECDSDTCFYHHFTKYSDIHEKFEVLEGIVKQLKLMYVNVLRPSCCNFSKYNSSIYIGNHLGRNDIAYRDSVREFDDFDMYHNAYIKGIAQMQEIMKNKKVLIDDEIRQLIGNDSVPKIYTMANDCQSCT